MSRKKAFVEQTEDLADVDLAKLLADNDMSQEELNRWKSNLIFHGVCALRATRVQDYRRSNSAASR